MEIFSLIAACVFLAVLKLGPLLIWPQRGNVSEKLSSARPRRCSGLGMNSTSAGTARSRHDERAGAASCGMNGWTKTTLLACRPRKENPGGVPGEIPPH